MNKLTESSNGLNFFYFYYIILIILRYDGLEFVYPVRMEVSMMQRRFLLLCLVLVYILNVGAQNVQAFSVSQGDSENIEGIVPSLFKHLDWRNIGPANMMGRVTDIEGVPGNPDVVFVGTASGGLWKTANGGTTWTPVFDKQPVASIGDLALEPGNPEVIYAGTGESNVRNSVSFGNGVYKSTDGGKSWVHLGLEDTRHIARIVINPKDPKIVFVGALGHAFGSNRQRGVFRSPDGGKTWSKVLFSDDQHGVADMDINPDNPNIVYAALWYFERKPWTFTSGDKQGGVYRSIDGGLTWSRLSDGLPQLVGRIGIKVSPSNPRVVYAITESPEGTLYRSDNGGDTFRQVSENPGIVSRGFYYTDLRVDPSDENRVYAVSSRLSVSIDGGKTFRRISPETHVDYHAFWIDPADPSRIWQGQDGGVCVTYDRGEKWDYVNNFPVGQFYQVYADNREPFYYVGGGMQDNGTWYGPGRSREPFGILNDDWRMISFGDGFHIIVHPDDHELFLSESQGGRIMRTDMRTREQQDASPQARRADGAPASTIKYRFHWNAPVILSPHDKNTVYVGSNVVFKSTDFGRSWEIISPDLTTNDPEKQKQAGGPAWPENTTAEFHCTIISLAESPVQPGVLWAGTDDGNLYVSLNRGGEWNNVVDAVPGIGQNSPVSHIEPSRTSAGLAYCSFDRHMLDDLHPYVYVTTDFGKSWENVTGNLPGSAYVWVVKEDTRSPGLLYVGTELGLFASFSRGNDWIKLHMQNLPVVAVHDILVHPRDNDLILGTHGRSLWILDGISFLQELSSEVVDQPAHVFTIGPAVRFSSKPTRYGIGDGVFRGKNPPYGALVTYYLKEKPAAETQVGLEILDERREVIRRIKDLPKESGLNRASWDLCYDRPRPRRERREELDFFRRPLTGPQVLPGTFTARLIVGERSYEKPVTVRLDPALEVSKEDLVERQRYAFELRDMQSYVNDGLRALDSVLSQLKERKDVIKDSKEISVQVLIAVKDHIQEVTKIQNTLSRPEGRAVRRESSKLVGRLRGLYQTVEGVNARPTEAQIAYFEELKDEYNTALAAVNQYLSQTANDLNDLLSQQQAPVIIVPEPVQYEKN